jgi:hypothetical protein
MLKIKLEEITTYTLTGKKIRYKLGDMSYGDWLVFKDNTPVYYFDVFDELYTYIPEIIKKNIPKYLENKFDQQGKGLSLEDGIPGIWSSKIVDKWFELEKLPLDFFSLKDLAVIKINEATLDLINSTDTVIEIENKPGYAIELIKPDKVIQGKVLFIGGGPESVEPFAQITLPELSKIKTKFRVNYEQAVIYKIIEKINFFDFIIILTPGFDFKGIDFLSEIKHYFELGTKRIFIINMKPCQGEPFEIKKHGV